MSRTALEIIQSRRKALEADTADQESAIAACQERIRDNRIKIEELQSVLRELEPEAKTNGTPKLRPTKAIFELLRQANDRGMTTSQIVDQLHDKVLTNASDRRHVIRTTLFQLRKAGRIVTDKEGRQRISD